MTSPFVIRPSRPLPVILVGSTPCSSTSFRAAGISRASLRAASGAGGGVGGTAAGSDRAAGGGGGGAAAAVPFASVSIVPITSPETTVPPSPLATFTRTPSAGAGSSRTTLSVSMSIRFSSRLTASPSRLCHASSVASATDSDSCGTFTSTIIRHSVRFFAGLGSAYPRRTAKTRARNAPEVLPSSPVLPERLVHERLLPLVVPAVVAACRRRGRGTPRVEELLVGSHVLLEVVLRLVPGALVLRLLLAPHHLERIRVALHLRRELLVRERVELLDADDRGVVRPALATRAQDVVVDLARARDDASHRRRLERVDLADHRLEAALRELLQARHRLALAQQRLRGHHDQGLAERPHHLPPQQVEDLRGCRRHAHLDVVLGAELEVPLEPRRRVLRPLPLVAMRQQQREAAHPCPLRLARGDELVDHHLRAVREVAELRLPDGQLVRLGARVSVF